MRYILAFLAVLSISACDMAEAVKIDSIIFEDGINPDDDDTGGGLPQGSATVPVPADIPGATGGWTTRDCYPDPLVDNASPTYFWVFSCIDGTCPPTAFDAYHFYDDALWRKYTGTGSHFDPSLQNVSSQEPTLDCVAYEWDSTLVEDTGDTGA